MAPRDSNAAEPAPTDATSDALPAPLVPADVDLRGMPFMPLDTVRVLDSDLYALSTGDEFKAAVTLWCKAWQQVPAASIPADDRILPVLSGAGSRWRKVKRVALRGFVECSDGRLYHPVIAAKALEAWDGRDRVRERRAHEAERQRRHREERAKLFAVLREVGEVPAYDTSTAALHDMVKAAGVTATSRDLSLPVTRDVTAKKVTVKLKRKLKGQSQSSTGPRTPAAVNGHDLKATDDEMRISKELQKHGVNVKPADPLLRQWLEDYTDEEIKAAAVFAIAKRKGEPPMPAAYLETVLNDDSWRTQTHVGTLLEELGISADWDQTEQGVVDAARRLRMSHICSEQGTTMQKCKQTIRQEIKRMGEMRRKTNSGPDPYL